MMFHAVVLAAAAAAAAAPYAEGFASLTVTAAQERAVATSPDVAAADARLRQAAAAFGAARGTLGPAAFASYAQAPQGGTLGETIYQRLTTVGVQTTVNDLIAYTPQVLAAQASYAAARADFLTAIASERTKVVGLYYDALRANAAATVRAGALQRAQADRRAAEIRFAAGDAPRLDVTRAQVAAARATADLATAQATVQNASDALATETGMSPANLIATTRIDVSAGVPPVQTAVTRALQMRPEVTSAEDAVRAERNLVHATMIGILPQITASMGYTRGTDAGVHVAGTSVNVQATLPLSGGPASKVKLERARLDEVEAKLAGVRRQVTLEVAAAVRNYEAAVRAADAAHQASSAASDALNATQTGYRNGASSSLEVAAARQAYDQAVLDEVNAYYAVIQARATVVALMGE